MGQKDSLYNPSVICMFTGNSVARNIKYGDGTTSGCFATITDVDRDGSDQSIHTTQYKWSGTTVASISARLVVTQRIKIMVI